MFELWTTDKLNIISFKEYLLKNKIKFTFF